MEGFRNTLGRVALVGMATLGSLGCNHAETQIREVEINTSEKAPRRGEELPPKKELVVSGDSAAQARQIQEFANKHGGDFVVESGNRYFWVEGLRKNVRGSVLAGLRIGEYGKCSAQMPCKDIALRRIERFGKGQLDSARQLFTFADFDEVPANMADSEEVGANGQFDRVADFTGMNSYDASSWSAHCSPFPKNDNRGYIDRPWHDAFDNGNEQPSRAFLCVPGENKDPQYYQNAYATAVAKVSAGIKAGKVSPMGPRTWCLGERQEDGKCPTMHPGLGSIDTGGGTGK